MAISQMRQLSLLLPKELLDQLLFYLQGLESVQIHDLRQEEDWQAAFEQALVGQPDRQLSQQDLLSRQEKLERLIADLEPFMPKKKLLEALKEEPLELSFAALEQAGKARDEVALLEGISKQLRVLQEAKDQIEADRLEVAALEKWKPLELTPQAAETFSHLGALIGTIPNTDDDALRLTLGAHPDLKFQEVFTDDTEHGVLIFYKAGSLEEVRKTLKEYGFKPFEYDHAELPAERVAQLKANIRQQEAVADAMTKSLAASKNELDQLKVQLDYLCNLSSRQESKNQLASTQNLAALEGWIESNQVQALEACLTEQFGQSILIQTREIRQDEEDKVPTKLKNNALVEPFELVTEMYSLPKYGDKDPTPVVSLFYFVFFGMMVADIGYGLLLFVGTSLALHFLHVKSGLAKNLRFFRLLGVAVIIWGLVYGSFFGFELPFALISTSSDAMTILVISVVFGFVTVLAGLFLSGLKNIRLKDYAEAYNAGFAWVLILLGLLLLALGNFFPSLAFAATIGQWLAIINALGILAVSIVSAKSLAGLGSGLFNLYNVSGYVGDLVSFTRLMALGLSGASIGSAFNLIVSLFPPVARFSIGILLFIALHLVNMFLSFLSGYVHGARLIFVEFFGKFYDGGGKPFTPLKPSEKYVQQSKK
ncbi:V-type ATP synthase subunit I [Streptococcus gordonii]|uniref:V-type ATP synthase subunit I n=1 Tax=Streptococcus gordonii TaxID=1302 RepID=A0AB34SDD1_STRGN|nr:V-type ATP synthase subunit I [Streptococcus gordonii]KJQ66061.1 V-type ATP synthase subunit I [Streptococcus gordonii]MCB6583201.1 V-type ATP synthase subunit I [Streptococcus gordonii]MCB7052655.1 V-type ATP synthase subunit I [Streptococcus gordonii]MCB7054725.1 V-type ATP synthase subunit I [Streptococcus gordonii]MCG4841834.1 V-type ATP synthase subunit I [Streptococcus gordonii]